MKFPPVDNILTIFNRAIQIRDLPEEMKPVPVNTQIPALPSDTAISSTISRHPSTKFQPPKFPTLDLSKKFSAPAPGRTPPLHHQQQQRTVDHHASREQEEEFEHLIEKERKSQLELLNLHQMNILLSEQLQKGIQILHHELLRSGEQKPDLSTVYLAIAGLKQVKDMMSGHLPFDPAVLQVNDTAFLAAADNKTAQRLQAPDNDERERQERETREEEELARKTEKQREEERERREEEQRRRRLEEERRRKEEEQRRRREEEERKSRPRAPSNIFEEDDKDSDLNLFTSTAPSSSKSAKDDKLSALLN